MTFLVGKSTRWCEQVGSLPLSAEGAQRAQLATDTFLREKGIFAGQRAKTQEALTRLVRGVNLPADKKPSTQVRLMACFHRLDAQTFMRANLPMTPALEVSSAAVVKTYCEKMIAAVCSQGPVVKRTDFSRVLSLLSEVAAVRADLFDPSARRMLEKARDLLKDVEAPTPLYLGFILLFGEALRNTSNAILVDLRERAMKPRLDRADLYLRQTAAEAFAQASPQRWQPVARTLATLNRGSFISLFENAETKNLFVWRPNWQRLSGLHALCHAIGQQQGLMATTKEAAIGVVSYLASLEGPAKRLVQASDPWEGPQLAANVLESERAFWSGRSGLRTVEFHARVALPGGRAIAPLTLSFKVTGPQGQDSDHAQLLTRQAELAERLSRWRDLPEQQQGDVVHMLARLLFSAVTQETSVDWVRALTSAATWPSSLPLLRAEFRAFATHWNDFSVALAHHLCAKQASYALAGSGDLAVLLDEMRLRKLGAYVRSRYAEGSMDELLAVHAALPGLVGAGREVPQDLRVLGAWRPNRARLAALRDVRARVDASQPFTRAVIDFLSLLHGPAIGIFGLPASVSHPTLLAQLQQDHRLAGRDIFQRGGVELRFSWVDDGKTYVKVADEIEALTDLFVASLDDDSLQAPLFYLFNVPAVLSEYIESVLNMQPSCLSAVTQMMRALREQDSRALRESLQLIGLWRTCFQALTPAQRNASKLVALALIIGKGSVAVSTLALRPESFTHPAEAWIPGRHLLQELFPENNKFSILPASFAPLNAWKNDQPEAIRIFLNLLRLHPEVQKELHPSTHAVCQFLLHMQGPARDFYVYDPAEEGYVKRFFALSEAQRTSTPSMYAHLAQSLPQYTRLITIGFEEGAEITFHAENFERAAHFLSNGCHRMVATSLLIGQKFGADAEAAFSRMFAVLLGTACFDGKLDLQDKFLADEGLSDLEGLQYVLDLDNKPANDQAAEYLRVFRLRQAELHPFAPGDEAAESALEARYITRHLFAAHLRQTPWMQGRSLAELDAALDYCTDVVCMLSH